ncbi:sigma-70 family RNA polymerase sigma factor [Kineosporia sp. NBRC 101731]|uniref:RNA polymerase sigma factor n=1 Tax=Kineosporia sp. NBRC 101731 TaxID=3032199 RepID=UPI0024A14F92|nr:sigma-70 family RNA polymerase sigma factor [Kineosporia sp. NBRC 101731]GLY30478.1 hypothetical protein Kisp02_38430 [Kineosporia sp. NBRC 101731]
MITTTADWFDEMTKRAPTSDVLLLADRVRAAQRGDRDVLGELIGEHLVMLYNVAGRALRGHADVDDVVQNTLISVVENLPSLREPERFSGWVLAIARREIADHLRRRRVAAERGQVLDEAAPVADPGSDFTELAILRLGLTGQRRQVAQASDWLDPESRFVLSLWWLELIGQITRADLSTALGTSAGHAAVRVRRMREQLETSREIVGALQTRPGCPDLPARLDGWDGVPGPVWRKRLARHLRDCRYCTGHRPALVPPERLLAGLVMLPLAYSLTGLPSVPAILADSSMTGAASTGAAGGWLGGSVVGKLVAVVAGAAVVAGGAAVVTHRDPPTTGRPDRVPVAVAPTQAVTPTQTATPVTAATSITPTTAQPSPSRTTTARDPRPPLPLYGTTVDRAEPAPPANVRPQPLPVRPEGTLEVAASGDLDPRPDVTSLVHRGEWVTFRGRGYVRVETAMAITERVGAVTMPSWTGLRGKLFHVASGRGYRLDDQIPDRPEGYTWMGDPEHGQAVLPAGAQQMWGWEYYYLDGEVTFTSNEAGADYNLYVHIVDRATIDDDLLTAPDPEQGRVRYGLNRDVGTNAAPVPQYVTRADPPDPATVPRRSRVSG